MILVDAKGYFEKSPEVRTIERAGSPDLQLAVGDFNWTVKRLDKEFRMFIGIEATGEKAWELADMPPGLPVQITGTLERHAWKDKVTDEWKSKHVIKFAAGRVVGEDPNQKVAGEPDEVPF